MNEYLEQAEQFLKDTKTDLKVEFNRFGSMSWDTNGEQRNIFDITLTRADGRSYTFEFGDSVNNSCKTVSKWEALGERETFEVYAGLKLSKVDISGGVKFKLSKAILDDDSTKIIEEKAEELYQEVQKQISKHNSELGKKLKSYSITRATYDEHFCNNFKKGQALRVVQDAIRRKKQELQNDSGLKGQKDDFNKPDAYSILACLNVSYYGNADEVYEMFGEMKPSQAEAIYQEDQELQKLFNEEELNALSEIA